MMCTATAAGMAGTAFGAPTGDLLSSRAFVTDMARLAEGLVMQDMHREFWDFDAASSVASVQAGLVCREHAGFPDKCGDIVALPESEASSCEVRRRRAAWALELRERYRPRVLEWIDSGVGCEKAVAVLTLEFAPGRRLLVVCFRGSKALQDYTKTDVSFRFTPVSPERLRAEPTAAEAAAAPAAPANAANAATATAATATAATATVTLAVAVPAPSDCPRPARPYHVLLTASSGAYQLWQTRVFHHHYLRIQRQDRCGEVGGFTRLLTQPAGAKPDGLMAVMRTVVVAELARGEDLGFVVLNRPNSVVKAFESGQLVFEERYVLVLIP